MRSTSAAQDGYRRGLRAGANLVTINLTPTEMRGDYVIYKRERFIMTEERVLAAIAAEGLAPSETGLADFYRENSRKGTTGKAFPQPQFKIEARLLFPSPKISSSGAHRVVVTGAGIVTALGRRLSSQC